MTQTAPNPSPGARRPLIGAIIAALIATAFSFIEAAPAQAAVTRSQAWPTSWSSPVGSSTVAVTTNYGAFSLGCPNADQTHGYTYYLDRGRMQHLGLDIDTPDYPVITNVRAIGAGRVVGRQEDWPGTALFVQHTAGDGSQFLAVYGHLRNTIGNIDVQAGDRLGDIYDNHLHFGIEPGTDAPVVGRSSSTGSNNCPNQPMGTVDPVQYLTDHPLTATPPPPPPPVIQPTLGQAGTVQGDFTGDGNTDAAVLYRYDNNQTAIYVFPGNGSGGLGTPFIAWNSGVNGWIWEYSKPVAADFTGDGKTDLAVLYGYAGARTRLWLFVSQGSSFDAPVEKWDSGAGNWDWSLTNWAVPGDFDGDQKADVAFLYYYDGAKTVAYVMKGNGTGGFTAPAVWWNSGLGNWYGSSTRMVAGNVDGDAEGKTDLILMYDYGNNTTGVFTALSTGTAFGAPSPKWSSGAGGWSAALSKLVAGDYTGDGIDDLGVVYAYPNNQTVFKVFVAGASGTLAAPVDWWNSGAGQWDGARVLPMVGRFDAGATADLAVLYRYDTHVGAFTFMSSGSAFGAPANPWDSGAGNWDGYRVLMS